MSRLYPSPFPAAAGTTSPGTPPDVPAPHPIPSTPDVPDPHSPVAPVPVPVPAPPPGIDPDPDVPVPVRLPGDGGAPAQAVARHCGSMA